MTCRNPNQLARIMSTVDVPFDFRELASQHSSFLAALGGALLTILGIGAALPNNADKAKYENFVANAIALTLVSFAGAHCLAEVASLPSFSDNGDVHSHTYRSYVVASVFIYLSAVGFLEVLQVLACLVAGKESPLPGFARLAQAAILVVILGYTGVSAYLTTESAGTNGILLAFWFVVLGIALASVLVLMKRNPSLFRTIKGLQATPVALVALASAALLYFIGMYIFDDIPLMTGEVMGNSLFVWIAAALSFGGDLNPSKPESSTVAEPL